MSPRIPGLELRYPLRPHPVSGAVIGAITGLAIGSLNSLSDVPEGGITALTGALGGAVAGILIGASLPVFANRWVAGAIVGAAATFGFAAAFPLWREMSWFIYPFMGAMGGIIYGALFWERPRPPVRSTSEPVQPEGDEVT